jgi:hypothetical protein
MIKGQLYGKNAIRASDFLSNEPANAYDHAKAAWHYVAAGWNCQKNGHIDEGWASRAGAIHLWFQPV